MIDLREIGARAGTVASIVAALARCDAADQTLAADANRLAATARERRGTGCTDEEFEPIENAFADLQRDLWAVAQVRILLRGMHNRTIWQEAADNRLATPR